MRALALLALLATGCAVQVTVTHRLETPVRCTFLQPRGMEIGVRCREERPPRRGAARPHPALGIPNL